MQDPKTLALDELPGNMPIIAVKNAVVFPIPGLPVPLSVGRQRTMNALQAAKGEFDHVLVISQRDPDEDEPGPEDLYDFGTVARILRLAPAADDTHELLLEGISRARVDHFEKEEGFLRGVITLTPSIVEDDVEMQALTRTLKEMVSKIIHLSPRIPDEALSVVEGIEDPSHLADLVITQMRLEQDEKQDLLEQFSVKQRLEALIGHLAKETEVLEISGRIRSEVRDALDKHQREVYLREQLKAIRKELGDDFGDDDDLDELSARIAEANMSEAGLAAAKKALKRLSRMNAQSAEYTVARTYIDWLLDLPWGEISKDNLNLQEARQVLDADHHGLEKVKRRIIEDLAVRQLKADMRGPILCLVGPPGVGKTSLGRSVARALGREFVRLSLGGVKDEAEIRGHRRTYIGALPGRIAQGLKRAGSMNPVFMFDEIDKLASDHRGDPASALLEVLDPAQNDSFSDHYLEIPLDLSQVLFLTTANRTDTIPGPLLDRMEIIEIPGYIEDEKLQIAEGHLVPRQLDEHGLTAEQVELDEGALRQIIQRYTREAGVRNLERQIASVIRGVARDVVADQIATPVTIGDERIREALGPQKYFPEASLALTGPGTALGLAWTPVGGDVLVIESAIMAGTGKLVLTGKLGDVMKESAQAARAYIHARAKDLGIDEALFRERDIHLHVPSGAIPKDGPSAGITILTALTSLLTEQIAQADMAMTGEITLRGVVLPVGGVKEKVIAAARAGIKTIILPKQNEGDLEEIPTNIRETVTFHPVEHMDEVLALALNTQPKRKGSKKKRQRPRAEA